MEVKPTTFLSVYKILKLEKYFANFMMFWDPESWHFQRGYKATISKIVVIHTNIEMEFLYLMTASTVSLPTNALQFTQKGFCTTNPCWKDFKEKYKVQRINCQWKCNAEVSGFKSSSLSFFTLNAFSSPLIHSTA